MIYIFIAIGLFVLLTVLYSAALMRANGKTPIPDGAWFVDPDIKGHHWHQVRRSILTKILAGESHDPGMSAAPGCGSAKNAQSASHSFSCSKCGGPWNVHCLDLYKCDRCFLAGDSDNAALERSTRPAVTHQPLISARPTGNSKPALNSSTVNPRPSERPHLSLGLLLCSRQLRRMR